MTRAREQIPAAVIPITSAHSSMKTLDDAWEVFLATRFARPVDEVWDDYVATRIPPAELTIEQQWEAYLATRDAPPGPGADEAVICRESLPDAERRLLENIGLAVDAAHRVWPGFRPEAIPSVVVLTDHRGQVTAVYTLGYDNPASLGAALKVIAPGLVNVHRVTDVNDNHDLELLAASGGHVDRRAGSEALAVRCGPGELNAPAEFAAVLVQYLFASYQAAVFKRSGAAVELDHYDYSAQNLELAMLEDRILIALARTVVNRERLVLAARLVAVRARRHSMDHRVRVDEQQERFEGTANYMKNRIHAEISLKPVRAVPLNDERRLRSVRQHFGFDRWASSGAVIMAALDELGVAGVSARIEAGESPMEVLATIVPPTTEAQSRLVAEAYQAHDWCGELPRHAQQHAVRALVEPVNRLERAA